MGVHIASLLHELQDHGQRLDEDVNRIFSANHLNIGFFYTLSESGGYASSSWIPVESIIAYSVRRLLNATEITQRSDLERCVQVDRLLNSHAFQRYLTDVLHQLCKQSTSSFL